MFIEILILIIIFIALLLILINDTYSDYQISGGKINVPLMRIIYELSKDVDEKEIKNETWDVYDKFAHDHYMYLSKLYDTDKIFSNYYKRILHILHPFDDINNNIKSNLVSGTPKITNAFMKQYEYLSWLDENNFLSSLINDNKLKMFDIASPPGMFIFATETYLREHYPNTNLEWHTSIFNEGDYNIDFKMDEFELYRCNNENVVVMNLLDQDDISNVIQSYSNQFDLVTGDVGVERRDYNELMEMTTYPLEYNQAVVCINLTREGGACFLKMFTCITYDTLNVLEMVNKYFEKVYICKPYTSRILNEESYIIGVSRNNKKYKDKKNIKTYNNNNKIIIEKFEKSRIEIKMNILNEVLYILKKNKKLKKSKKYNNYIKEVRPLMNVFENEYT